MAWDTNTQGTCCNAPEEVQPALYYDFSTRALLPIIGPPAAALVTSRATQTYRQGRDTRLEIVGPNFPVWECDKAGNTEGLRIEGRMNTLTPYSNDLTQASVYTTNNIQTIVAESTAQDAPDGTYTASRIVEDTSTGTHNVRAGFSATTAVNYLYSVYLRAGTRTKAELRLSGAAYTTALRMTVTLTGAGTIDTTIGSPLLSGIEEVGYNGWYRVWIGGPATATGTLDASLFMLDNTGANSYTGDGSGRLYAWGWNITSNTGDTPVLTSPVFAGSATATREADFAMVALNTIPAFNIANGGTVYCEYWLPRGFTGSAAAYEFHRNDGTNDNCISHYHSDTLHQPTIRVGAAQTVTNTPAHAGAGVFVRTARVFSAASSRLTATGMGTVSAQTPSSYPTGLTHLNIGYRESTNTHRLNAVVRRFALFSELLSDSDILAMVAP